MDAKGLGQKAFMSDKLTATTGSTTSLVLFPTGMETIEKGTVGVGASIAETLYAGQSNSPAFSMADYMQQHPVILA